MNDQITCQCGSPATIYIPLWSTISVPDPYDFCERCAKEVHRQLTEKLSSEQHTTGTNNIQE